jgi:hypothetical protein
MASYTIEIPDPLHHEIQERRYQIDVAGICTEARVRDRTVRARRHR